MNIIMMDIINKMPPHASLCDGPQSGAGMLPVLASGILK
jgi:hypothetical protein